jgi:hypothetical protein
LISPSSPERSQVAASEREMSSWHPFPVRSRSRSAPKIPTTAMRAPIGIDSTVWGCHGSAGLTAESRPECAVKETSWPAHRAYGPSWPNPESEHQMSEGISALAWL